MRCEAPDQTTNEPKRVERGYGSAPLAENYSGVTRCPAIDQEKRCSAIFSFQIESLDELRESRSEIQECPNPDGLDNHRVIIFMGKRDGQEFPFIQATHMCHK